MLTSEAELITHAVSEMQKRGVAVTPARVELAVHAAHGKPTVSVAEATRLVNEASAAVSKVLAKDADPNAGRRVVGMYLAPRGPDGSGGAVRKMIRVGPKPRRQYAEPVPYYETTNAMAPSPASAEVGAPIAADELAHLQDEAKTLQALIDDPATSVVDRQRAGYRLTAIRSRIEQLETALHPVPQAGEPATAGHYAPHVPTWNEPRLSDSKKAELEAEAAGLRTQMRSPDLTPSQKIRLEQSLTHIERVLGKTGTGDAVAPQHR